MIDPELKAELERIEKKIDAAYAAANQSRQWMKWTTIETAVVILGTLFFDSVRHKFASFLVFLGPQFLKHEEGVDS